MNKEHWSNTILIDLNWANTFWWANLSNSCRIDRLTWFFIFLFEGRSLQSATKTCTSKNRMTTSNNTFKPCTSTSLYTNIRWGWRPNSTTVLLLLPIHLSWLCSLYCAEASTWFRVSRCSSWCIGITTTWVRAYAERTPRCAFSPPPLPDYPGYPWRCAYSLPVLLPDSLRADQPARGTAEGRCRVSETSCRPSIINLLYRPRCRTMKQRFQ